MAKMFIRVGICGCSPTYQGKFAGRTIRMPSGRLVTLQEFSIPDKGQRFRKRLRDTRCHFFLDYHTAGLNIEVALDLLELVSNGENRGWKLYIGGFFPQFSRKRESICKIDPPPSRILAQLESLLNEMERDGRLEKWLANMTPQGWQLPQSEMRFLRS